MMSLHDLVDTIQKGLASLAILGGGWWFAVKFLRREEHFPRIGFEVSANFLGIQKENIVTEVIATLENTGIVPLKIHTFTFKLRALFAEDEIRSGDKQIRFQIFFPHIVSEGSFVPESWEYTFVQPGVRTEYNFVCALPINTAFVRVESKFLYSVSGESHHAAKVLRVSCPKDAGHPDGLAEHQKD
jgi:hypothetical protein